MKMTVSIEKIREFRSTLSEDARDVFDSIFDDADWEDCHGISMQEHIQSFKNALEDGEALENAGIGDDRQADVEKLYSELTDAFDTFTESERRESIRNVIASISGVDEDVTLRLCYKDTGHSFLLVYYKDNLEKTLNAAMEAFDRHDVECHHGQGRWGACPTIGEEIELGSIEILNGSDEEVGVLTVYGVCKGIGTKIVGGRLMPFVTSRFELNG